MDASSADEAQLLLVADERLGSELAALRARIIELEADNTHLRGLLRLSPAQSSRPEPGQTAIFEADPGPVTALSSPAAKVAFYAELFRSRTDVYAVRWDNDRTGQGGWMPAVHGGFPLLDGDRCHWLAADFDGPTALVDALSYLKAARANGVPAGLEVSRSGVGAHAWIFFTAPVAAAQARQLGTALLREAMTMSGRMNLASYDRLFPSQDLLPAGGIGNLIAAPYRDETVVEARRSSWTWRPWSPMKTRGPTCPRCRGSRLNS